jgi:hypothetical protein
MAGIENGKPVFGESDFKDMLCRNNVDVLLIIIRFFCNDVESAPALTVFFN